MIVSENPTEEHVAELLDRLSAATRWNSELCVFEPTLLYWNDYWELGSFEFSEALIL